MASTVVERYGSLSAVGVAKETTFGTPVTPTEFAPFTDATLESDPGLFYPPVVMGVRDVNVFALYGQRKNTGDISAPFYPTNGASLWTAAMGADGGALGSTGGYGVVPGSGVTTSNSTTLSAAVGSVGATSVSITSATGYVQGGYIVIDVNNTTTPTTSEIRKISNVSGTTITLDSALNFTHANGAAVKFIAAAASPLNFTHTILSTNTLPSLTVEKNIGGYQSIQFAGSRVGKYNLKLAAGDSPAEFSASIVSQTPTVLTSPSPISVVNESPFVFAEATLGLFGNSNVAQVMSVNLDLENGLKPTYTFNGSHDLQFLTPLTRKVTGQIEVVFTSLNDADWGYYTKMQNQTQGSLTLTMAHPSSGSSFTISLPQINIAKYADALKLEDVVMTTLDFEASYALGAAVPSTISSTMTNGKYLPY